MSKDFGKNLNDERQRELEVGRFHIAMQKVKFIGACRKLHVVTEEDVAKLICEYTGVRVNIGTEEYYDMQDFALRMLIDK